MTDFEFTFDTPTETQQQTAIRNVSGRLDAMKAFVRLHPEATVLWYSEANNEKPQDFNCCGGKGWDVFETSRGDEVQRCDECGILESDDEAIRLAEEAGV